MWPAMWMLPKDSVYGAWPLSGTYFLFMTEILIIESLSRWDWYRWIAREWTPIYSSVSPFSLHHFIFWLPKPPNSGSNYVQGSLNWGPAPNLNGVSKTYSWWSEKRKSFASGFHTYALEWTPDFLYVLSDIIRCGFLTTCEICFRYHSQTHLRRHEAAYSPWHAFQPAVFWAWRFPWCRVQRL